MEQIKNFITYLLGIPLFILCLPLIFVVVSIMLVIDFAYMEMWSKYNISDAGIIILSILALPLLWIVILFTLFTRIFSKLNYGRKQIFRCFNK